MSDKFRVVWSEGLFLRPQHFQQQDRYVEWLVEGRTAGLRTHSWGLAELELDRELLAIGRLAVRRARGVLPDGTPFSIPEEAEPPAALDIAPDLRDEIIYLALPLRQVAATLLHRPTDAAAGAARYQARVTEARDVSHDTGENSRLDTASLSIRLMAQHEAGEDFARIPLAHVLECRADKQVILDEGFVPTVLQVGAAPPLRTFLAEVQGLLYQRAESLAQRAAASGRGGTAEIVEFLLLQAINRYDPWVTHLAATGKCHPEDLYQLLLQITGELSTLTVASRRPPKFPPYRHDALRETFAPLMNALRTCLAMNPGGRVVEIPLELKKFNIRVGVIADKTLIDQAVFILAARADVPAEDFRRRFRTQCKVGPEEKIGDLVNFQLSGIELSMLPVAPRQLHNIAGSFYFELERGTDLWRALKTSGGLAIHVAGDFPGLVLECWAIRSDP